MKKLHLICNAHLDPVWLWDWEEGAAAAISTFRSAVDLANEFDYIFCHNEAILYQWVEEYDPVLFSQIQELAKAGKWKVMGGWYLQPDCNMPTGESFVRQIMEGRKYFGEKLGQCPTTAMNVDPFGHSIGLPQILKGCGYDAYLICRPGAAETDIPDDFLWEGPDGSCVRVCRASDHYNSPMGDAVGKIRHALETHKDQDVGILLWGVGNHGGGASRKDLRDIGELMRESGTRILHSTPEAYMAEPAELPTIRRSLRCMPGCYTSMTRIKQRHRRLESQLYQTEKMCAAAAIQTGMAYPAAELRDAQRALMLAQFHDILPGSAIAQGEETGLRLLDHGLEITGRLRMRAMFAFIAKEKKAQPDTYPVLVYNPHPYPVETTVDVPFILERQNWEDTYTDLKMYQGGTPLPTQVIKEPSNLNLDWAKRAVFTCTLKPMTLNRFDCKPNVVDRRPTLPVFSGDFTFRNDRMSAHISGETGLMDYYEADGHPLIQGTAAPVLYRDNADPWGMSPEQFRKLAEPEEAFRLMSPEEAAGFVGAEAPVAPVRIIEYGDVLTEVESLLCCRSSAARINWRFYRDRKDVDVTLHLLFLEKNALVKWHLPVAFPGEVSAQVAYAQEKLPQDGRELVAQDWICSSDGQRTLAVLRKGSYGFDCTENELHLTLVRGAVYAAHPIAGRQLVRDDRCVPRMDQGMRAFSFRLTGGNSEEVAQSVERDAQVFNEVPFCLQAFPTGSGLGTQESFLSLSGDPVVMTALKQNDQGECILRLFNNTDSEAHCTATLLGKDQNLTFRPFQVRTFRIREGNLQPCEQMEI